MWPVTTQNGQYNEIAMLMKALIGMGIGGGLGCAYAFYAVSCKTG